MDKNMFIKPAMPQPGLFQSQQRAESLPFNQGSGFNFMAQRHEPLSSSADPAIAQ
jgi:hypothetical protein